MDIGTEQISQSETESHYKRLYEETKLELEKLKKNLSKKSSGSNAKIAISIARKPTKVQCTKAKCVDDDDEYKLACKLCKRSVHYQCTGLPLYQIDYFVRESNNYRKFICENCTQIQQWLVEDCVEFAADRSLEVEQEMKNLKQNVSMLRNETTQLEKGLSERTNECTKLELSRKKLIEKVKTLEMEIKEHAKKGHDLCADKLINENNSEDTNDANKESSGNKYSIENIIDDRLKTFEKKIDQVMSTKLTSICQTLQEKLNETIVTKTIVDIPEKMNESFKDALTKNIPPTTIPNFKQVITDERNNQLIQEKERKRRATNIIIHGVDENSDKNADSDKNYVKGFLETLGVDTHVESVARLGKTDEERTRSRPLKIRFRSEEEKHSVMNHLSNLKKAGERFNKISVTDDYTIQERQEIKRFVAEANKKNEVETGNFYWRVRGSPKTGLELRRVPKKVEN